jgi:hypothetical protein
MLRTKILLVLAVLCPTTGCGGSGLKMGDFDSLPVRTATADELVARINDTAASIGAIRAKAQLGLREKALSDEKTCSGLLLARKTPEKGLYLKGYRQLIPTFFTLVGDGENFWLHVPGDDVVYTGAVDFVWSEDDSVEFYLNAGDLVCALFLEPVAENLEMTVREEGTAYIATLTDGGILLRELWFERRGFTVTREIYYDEAGKARLEILRKQYAELDDRLYPTRLELHDTRSRSAVYIDFTSILLNPDHLPERAFQFEIPAGTEVRRVNNASPVP